MNLSGVRNLVRRCSTLAQDTTRETFPRILHEEKEWYVVEKPAGWHTVTIRSKPQGEEEKILERWLIEQHASDLPEAGLVHRLDQDTSGCLLVAKTPPALERLRRELKTESVSKSYLALTCGLPQSRGVDSHMPRNGAFPPLRPVSAAAKFKQLVTVPIPDGLMCRISAAIRVRR